MPWGGSAPNQTYTRSDGTRTGTAVNATAKNNGANNTAILADNRENDFATALNLVLKRDGGNSPTADLPMNSHKLTGMSAGSARTDSLRIDQVQDGDLVYAEASGTKNAIVLTTTPTCSPVEGMVIGFFAEFDSDSTVTVDLNGNGNVDLQYIGASLVGGEIQNGQFHSVAFDGTQWQLVNPYVNPTIIGAQPLDADLTAYAALSSAGMVARTGAGTVAVRTITGTANQLTVTDGDGVAGNPTISLPADVLVPTVLTVPNTGLHLLDTNASHDLIVKPGSNLTADHTLTLTTGDADRTLDISAANVTVSSFGATLVDDADAATALATLGAAGQGLQTIVVPAGAMLSATTSGAASGQIETSSNKINMKVLDFDDAADEYAHFNIAMPKSWNEGTITFRVFWTTSATDTDGVAWALEAVAVSDNESADAAWGTAVVVTDDAQGAANEVLVTDVSGAVTVGGTPAAGDIVFFRVTRDVSDANDDMTEDARLISVQLFFTTNAATDV